MRANPEIAVFLAIASGVLLGRIHLGSIHLGSVAGALLLGLLIGQIGIEVHERSSAHWASSRRTLPWAFPIRVSSCVLTSRKLAGRTLRQIKQALVGATRMGCYVAGITRQAWICHCCPTRYCAVAM
ncbi:hypothetical protein [Pseudomonas putida]|uniref:aspartate-alanine antiporter-like transporter n=1 Tax=Pseudomonas putida TaxID=303 RepID=UPI0009B75C38